MREPYILYRRPDGAKDGKMFYAGFWDDAAGDYTSRRSVGALQKELQIRIPAQPTSKAGARAIVDLWLESHSPGQAKTSAMLALDYLTDFWEDEGTYAKGKAARDKPLSSQYLYNNRNYVRKYVKPFLEAHARGLPLTRLGSALLERLAMSLFDEDISTKTANAVLAAVSKPLAEAERLGLIASNPARRVEKLAEEDFTREPLTITECRTFFHLEWEDARLYAANLLAATTGLRLGEVRGLLCEDIRGDYIHVCHNWQDREKLKGPKGSKGRNVKVRDVPLPPSTGQILGELAARNPWGDGFAIHGDRRGRPLGKQSIERGYNDALEVMGIDEAARKARGLGFHAWRHFYNSQLRGQPGIPDHALRQLTGHQSEEMTELYTEITQEQRSAVARLADGLLIQA